MAVTRAISKLDQPDRRRIAGILTPIIAAVQDMLADGALGIKDPETRQKVRAVLLTIQTALNGIQLTLAGGA